MTTGTQLVALADGHRGERYIFGARAPLDNPRWKGPWDCAEFVSWVVFQSTGLVLGCTNNRDDPSIADPYSGAWARDAANSPLRIGIGQAIGIAGALVIRKPIPNGIGHIAISRGDGSSIEAHSPSTGVCNRKVNGRRWDIAMLVPMIDYPDELPGTVFQPPKQIVFRLTLPPMRGPAVKKLQKALKGKGFDPGEIDGVFGPHTEAAVRAFQLQHKLVPDGEAGKQTLSKLGLSAI